MITDVSTSDKIIVKKSTIPVKIAEAIEKIQERRPTPLSTFFVTGSRMDVNED
ncbi:UDP-glucose 6-dehydrogenase 2 [Acorus calamus]|uniref:UDP-glucose 6-dehydrogenase 2 n=1 Tax=Acorus calamus TaxID=4465 RepID=A0AAV9CNA3_ACOCL|nr:UDP-glucose 6-dehydrogenase 2 [Acorus calamus]